MLIADLCRGAGRDLGGLQSLPIYIMRGSKSVLCSPAPFSGEGKGGADCFLPSVWLWKLRHDSFLAVGVDFPAVISLPSAAGGDDRALGGRAACLIWPRVAEAPGHLIGPLSSFR